MLTLFRWTLRLALGMLVGLGALLGLALWFALRSVPVYDAERPVTGIAAPVEIVRTSDAIPHIFATRDADAFFALGYAQAQDRLVQMTLLRRAAQGRLAEVLGPVALPSDELARRLGLARRAAASLAAQDAPTAEALRAYADGVNAWIATVNAEARGRGAPEMFLAPAEIAFWQPADSLAVWKLVAAMASGAIGDEVLRARLSLAAPSRGPEVVAEPGLPALPAYAALFAPGTAFPPPSRLGDSPDLGLPRPGAGMWGTAAAVAPARTAAGGALLAGDLGGPLAAPGLFALARIELAGVGGVIGVTIPGVPAILSGRHRDLAWTLVPAQVDDADLAIEEVDPGDPSRVRGAGGWTPFAVATETIRVRGGPNVAVTLRETAAGPVLPAGHAGIAAILPAGYVAALRWTGLAEDDASLSALMGLMRAPDRAAAATAAAGLVAPAMRVVLADASGVSQVLAGARPARDPGHPTAGALPAPGWDPAVTWTGVLPPEAPREGAQGVVAVTGRPDRPEDALRLGRLGRLLGGREVHTRDSLVETQLDVVSPAARALLPLIAAELWFTGEPAARGTPERLRQDALALLAEWDGAMSEHLPEPLIATAWLSELQHRIVRDELGPLADDLTALRPAFLEAVFRNTGGAAAWCDVLQSAPQEDCPTLARQALDAALLELVARHGGTPASWRWGDAQVAEVRNPILSRAPGFGAVVTLRQPLSGDGSTLARTEVRRAGAGPLDAEVVAGVGARVVIDLADPDSSVFVVATGQSGHPLSRHYDDLGVLWRRGESVAMSLDPALARAGAEGVTRLVPAGD